MSLILTALVDKHQTFTNGGEPVRYSINPEFNAKLKEEWDNIGLSREVQEVLLQYMDSAALNMLSRIARCLVDEGLSLEKIKSITGCSIEDLYPSTLYH
jgi:hypothetical protein